MIGAKPERVEDDLESWDFKHSQKGGIPPSAPTHVVAHTRGLEPEIRKRIIEKVKGNMKYLFSMMDDETRFWIAQEVAETKTKHDARQLFIQAKKLMGKQPKELITDGLPTYSVTAMREFPKTIHTRKIGFDRTVHNNNKMERFNGEIRDREKTMRGLKTKKTAILTGYQLFHNYFRPHEALGNKTPAEACGIKIEGENKWRTLIQNASKK